MQVTLIAQLSASAVVVLNILILTRRNQNLRIESENEWNV